MKKKLTLLLIEKLGYQVDIKIWRSSYKRIMKWKSESNSSARNHFTCYKVNYSEKWVPCTMSTYKVLIDVLFHWRVTGKKQPWRMKHGFSLMKDFSVKKCNFANRSVKKMFLPIVWLYGLLLKISWKFSFIAPPGIF